MTKEGDVKMRRGNLLQITTAINRIYVTFKSVTRDKSLGKCVIMRLIVNALVACHRPRLIRIPRDIYTINILYKSIEPNKLNVISTSYEKTR